MRSHAMAHYKFHDSVLFFCFVNWKEDTCTNAYSLTHTPNRGLNWYIDKKMVCFLFIVFFSIARSYLLPKSAAQTTKSVWNCQILFARNYTITWVFFSTAFVLTIHFHTNHHSISNAKCMRKSTCTHAFRTFIIDELRKTQEENTWFNKQAHLRKQRRKKWSKKRAKELHKVK